MEWNSIDQIAEEFELKSDPKDPHAIRHEIRKLMADLHPDPHGGDFKSEDDEKKYLRLNEALQYLDSPQQGMLVPIDYATTLVEKVTQSLFKANRDPVETKISKALNERRVSIRRQFYTPKISLGIVTTLLLYVFLAPQTLMEHPYIGPILMSAFVQQIWFISVFVLGFFWILTWRKEKRLMAITIKLFSLDYHMNILETLRSQTSKFSRSKLKDRFHNYPVFQSLYDELNIRFDDSPLQALYHSFAIWPSSPSLYPVFLYSNTKARSHYSR